MSIQSDIEELGQLNQELKRLQDRCKGLREARKVVEARIASYLDNHDQPGVRYKGTTVIARTKQRRKPRKKKEREMVARYVLEKYGIQDTQAVYDEMMEMMRGDPEEEVKVQLLE